MENFKSNNNIDTLKQVLNECASIVKKFSAEEHDKASNGKTLDELQKAANDFLVRIQLNILGLIPLLDLYKSRRAMILPIGLIMRSISSDFLTLCYLISFSDTGKNVNETVRNELHVLDRDFIKSIFEIKRMEGLLDKYLANLPDQFVGSTAIDQFIREAKGKMPHLFDAVGNSRKVADIRKTSDPLLFSKYDTKIGEPNSFLSEKYKWERIEKGDSFKKYILVFMGYKIFSQFQHYSRFSMDLLQEHHEPKLFHELVLGVNGICIITDIQIQLIDSNDNVLLTKMRELKNTIDMIFHRSQK